MSQEALALFREMGDRYGMAGVLGGLAGTAYENGRYAEARELRFADVQRIGEDVALTLYPRAPSPSCSQDSSKRSDG